MSATGARAARRTPTPDGVTIVGRGKVGRALYTAFRAAGVPTQLLRGRARRRPPLRHGTLILCVPDGAISTMAAELAPRLGAVRAVLHCAGARSAEELAACRAAGAAVATFHPLASFADPRRPPALSGVSIVGDGDGPALARARKLARQLGAHFAQADLNGATYHACAALLANGAVALAHAAKAGLVEVGLAPRAAERALSALLASVAKNLATVGLPGALTGPVARGDATTVARHLTALEARVPAHAATYAALLPALVRCAEAAGLPRGAAAPILAIAARPARRQRQK